MRGFTTFFHLHPLFFLNSYSSSPPSTTSHSSSNYVHPTFPDLSSGFLQLLKAILKPISHPQTQQEY
ncbi:hypothetical protein PGTUg99_001648 [Puccinia graminis f. sp. tritici]|uniref:Uncharacterized protein n=1 Tax=Puccinia graminis f. sp. tritici TaxID=56615 RepID=A0A5B0PAQ5_PUCGR|nr:hypothetical protein PGTUg99_001648 [Puccinia graminis f. sp. tritici]